MWSRASVPPARSRRTSLRASLEVERDERVGDITVAIAEQSGAMTEEAAVAALGDHALDVLVSSLRPVLAAVVDGVRDLEPPP
jgi:hypothetical protein